MEYHGYPPEEWKVERSKNSIWEAQTPDGIEVFGSSKITVKPIENELSIYYLKKWVDEELEDIDLEKGIGYKPMENTGIMAEISLYDVHLGKLAWHGETGENYDIHIAQKRFRQVIDDNIYKLKKINPDKILFPIGNDFFNFDNDIPTTNKGTFQDTDVRWQKLFDIGMKLLIETLERLSEIAPVDSFVVPGNHDFKTSYYLIYGLGAKLNSNDRVYIDTSPKLRKYIQYGRNLIGFSHGSELTKKNKRTVMQVEAPKKWGSTKYREFHCGHLHSQQTEEHGGIIFRDLSAITGTDAWHYKKGYVGALKQSQTFLWHKEAGLYQINNCIIDV